MLFKPGEITVSDCSRTTWITQTRVSTFGAFKKPKIPLALSRSSISGLSSNGRPNTPASQRSSVASYASATSSMTSLPSTFTKRSFPRSDGSYTSQSSYHSHSTQRSSLLPQWIFQTLPPEIYDAILHQLKELHLRHEARTCQTCLLRDLCTLSLTSRAWDKAVVKVM